MIVLPHLPLLLTLAGASGPAMPECPPARAEDHAWASSVLQWITMRTDTATGLPLSYDPTVDRAMDGQAAIYDLAIAAILFADTGRLEAGTRIVDRLELMWTGRGLPNVVDTRLATIGIESVVHTGPNAWVALAAHRLWLRSGRIRHLRFAEAIADWIVSHREREDSTCTAPSWLAPPPPGVSGRAPAMGPCQAFSPVGAVLPWQRIVSTEHALDVYALLRLLKDEPAVSESQRRSYGDALVDVHGYLQAAATSPTCRESAGVGLRNDDRATVCIETGFGPRDNRDPALQWSRTFNAADVYYWWVAAVPDRAVAGARSHAEMLAEARSRFHQVVHVDGQTITGTDYFTCTAAPEDQVCRKARKQPSRVRDGGAAADGPTEPDAAASERNASPTDTSSPSNGALAGEVRGTCSLLGAGVCAERKRKTADARSFWQFERTRPTVSVEWTGEAILANRLVGQGAYADELLASMDRLQILSPASAGAIALAYPYATDSCECVFDGAWLTPARSRAAHALPGSLAGTVWVAFGRLGINPFDPARVPGQATSELAPAARERRLAPVRLEPPPCPLATEGTEPSPSQAGFSPAQSSPEALVTAAWRCLDSAKQRAAGADAAKQRIERIKEWVAEILGRRLVDAQALVLSAADEPIPFIGIEDLARRQQDERAFPGPGCQFKDFALNEVATARLIRALANRGSPQACEDARVIVQTYPSGCFWHPREVPGEPHDRFQERTSSWTVIGSPPRLAGAGYHVPVINVLANELPECVAKLEVGASGRDAAAVAEARRVGGFPWLIEAETHAYGANNLFFSEQHRGIGVVQGEGRLGAAFDAGRIQVVPYVYGRGIDARGAAPLDQVVWLRNWGAGGGLEARLKVERPIWLRELDIRLGARGGHIGYQTPAAPTRLTDWELLGTLGGWALVYFPIGEKLGLWSDVSAAAYGGQATLWTVDQRSLWLGARVQAGLRLVHVIEPYATARAVGNLLQDTDWDNNLRLGVGARFPLLYFADGPGRRFVLLLDGSYEHTIAYWPWVEYVPSFRPLSDYRISLDARFAWSGR